MPLQAYGHVLSFEKLSHFDMLSRLDSLGIIFGQLSTRYRPKQEIYLRYMLHFNFKEISMTIFRQRGIGATYLDTTNQTEQQKFHTDFLLGRQ